MREAVIVSYARTGLAKSGRGGFNITPPMSHGGPRHQARRRARRLDQGICRGLLSRQLRAWRAATSAARPRCSPACRVDRRRHVNRFCSSGLQTIALAANYDPQGRLRRIVGRRRGVHLAPRRRLAARESIDPELLKIAPDICMAMIETADIVAERYKLSREYQDEYSLHSQHRIAAAQQAGKFKDEIVPMKTKMKVVDKETKAESIVDYVVDTRRVQPSRHDARRPRQARAGARAPAISSPPATPASSPTAPPPSC